MGEEIAVDTAEANTGQSSQGCKSALVELLCECRDRELFPANPKVVPACHGAKLRLPLPEKIVLHVRLSSDTPQRRKP